MTNLKGGVRFLTERGLNLVAVLESAVLPDETTHLIEESGIPLDDYRRFVLIGHGGRRMWEALHERGAETTDPIDHYSVSLTRSRYAPCQILCSYVLRDLLKAGVAAQPSQFAESRQECATLKGITSIV